MFTHNQAVDLFKQFAEKHLQVRSMGVGFEPEIGADTLMLYYDPENPNKVIYPLLWVVVTPAQVEGKETTLRYSVLIMDLVNDDRSNEQEVLSDTLLIQHDLYAELQDPAMRDNYALGKSFSLEPFADKFDDAVAGWKSEISFRTLNLRDRCSVPMSEGMEAVGNTVAT